jgi:hypothetical protein
MAALGAMLATDWASTSGMVSEFRFSPVDGAGESAGPTSVLWVNFLPPSIGV